MKTSPPPPQALRLIGAIAIMSMCFGLTACTGQSGTAVASSASAVPMPVSAAHTASSVAATEALPVYDLIKEPTVPPQYGDFSFDMSKLTASDMTDMTGWTKHTDTANMVANESGVYWKPSKGAQVTFRHIGQWTDGTGAKQWINARLTVNDTNDGYLYKSANGRIFIGIGHWNNGVTQRNSFDMTIDFQLDDGSTPTGFRGVTGFTDLDGPGAGSGPNEGWELLDGFDAAYVRADAHLERFGTNGWRGITDSDDFLASAPDSKHNMQHYLGTTFTGPSIRMRYSNAGGYTNGSNAWPVPATVAYRLTYDANGGAGAPQQKQ